MVNNKPRLYNKLIHDKLPKYQIDLCFSFTLMLVLRNSTEDVLVLKRTRQSVVLPRVVCDGCTVSMTL